MEGHYPSVKKKKTKQNKTKKSNRLISNSEPFHLSQGGYSEFQVTGMIGMFWVGQFGRYFWGIQNNLKICGSARAYPGQ